MENAAKAADGEAPEEDKPYPEVPPPEFINACKAVLINFGNLSYDEDRGIYKRASNSLPLKQRQSQLGSMELG